MGGGDKPEAPKINYKKDIEQFVSGLRSSMPDVLGMEGRYRNDFTGMNLGDVRDMLQGTKGEQGLMDQSGKLITQAGKQLGKARAQELRQMTGQSGQVRNFLESVSPESAQMVAFANQNAQTAQRAAMGLTGSEQRSAQQFAREGAADRGRLMDNSAMASEVLNRDSILGAKRQEAQAATQNAYSLSNSFYSAPGLQALSSMPNSYQAGQGYLGMGLGAIGSAKPQLVDIGAGLNLGASNRQNQFAANAAAAGRVNPYISAGAGALSGAATGATVGSALAATGLGTATGVAAGAATGVGAGAAAGAAAGSVVPVWGTAIGALIGAGAAYYGTR
jgi:hypothetical protein